MFLFIPIELIIHIIEELPRFPAWASKYFGKTTLDWYLISHAVIYPAVLLVAYQANKGEYIWIFIAVATQTAIFTNGLFHLVTTFVFKEYSPGLISSILVTIPFSAIFYKDLLVNQTLSLSTISHAILTGSAISFLIIVSLYHNFDFKFRDIIKIR